MGGFRCFPILYISFLFLVTVAQPPHSKENHLEKAKALNLQVIKLYKQGRYQEAAKIAEKTLAILKASTANPSSLNSNNISTIIKQLHINCS